MILIMPILAFPFWKIKEKLLQLCLPRCWLLDTQASDVNNSNESLQAALCRPSSDLDSRVRVLTLVGTILGCLRQFLCLLFIITQTPSSSTMFQLRHPTLRFSHRIYPVSLLHSTFYISGIKTSGTSEAFFDQVYSGPSGKPADLSAAHWMKNSKTRAPAWVVSFHFLA